jgi:membrane protease YdiL (CAAX protease family)
VTAAHRQRILVPVATVAACAALALRTPATLSMRVLVPVGLLGAFGGVPMSPRPRIRADRLTVIGLGVAPFVLVRLFGPPLPATMTLATIAAATIAAVAEEALFRRFVYGWFEPRGAALAVAGAAFFFAAIHIPVYGSGVVFIDFGAGLIFGYQRWATGGWAAPAATHVIVNLLQLPWAP